METNDDNYFTTDYRGGKGTLKFTKLRKFTINPESKRKISTPNSIAMNNLEKVLDPRSKGERSVISKFKNNNWLIFQKILTNYELLRFRNIPLLAQVLFFLNDKYDQNTPVNYLVNFSITSKPYIDRLLPLENLGAEKQATIEMKLSLEFLAYTDSIIKELLNYKQNDGEYDFSS